jgi:hypothetical protein
MNGKKRCTNCSIQGNEENDEGSTGGGGGIVKAKEKKERFSIWKVKHRREIESLFPDNASIEI